MEISQLQVFCIVAEKMSFTKAAEELKLTQSAVSYQIKKLEESIGDKLFKRNKTCISLTSQGNIVLDYAHKLLQQINLLKKEITENRETLRGDVKIVSQTRSLKTPFSKVRKDFQQKYKDINLLFHSALDTENIIELIRQGKFDVGLAITRRLKELTDDDLQFIPFGEFDMTFIVGKDHHFANTESLNLDQLKNEELILPDEKSWLRIICDNCFHYYDFVPNKIYEASDAVTIISLVESNQGIGILPRWAILEQLKSGSLLPFKVNNVKTHISTSLVFSSVRRSKLVDRFVHHLLETEVEGFRKFSQNSQLLEGDNKEI